MSEIRSLLETLERIDEAIPKKLEDEINKVIKNLSDSPTREEIESAIEEVESIKVGSFIGVSKGYKEREFLGRLAEKLGVRGLYTFPGGRTLVTTDKDDRGNYESSLAIGAGDFELNKSIAKISLGLFPQPRLDKIIKKHPEEEIFKKSENDDKEDDADSDSYSNKTDKTNSGELLSSNTPINLSDPEDIEGRVGELLGQYQELIRKMNESAPISIKGYLKEYGVMLEDLSREEAQRLQAIYKDLEMLSQAPEVSDEIKNNISSEIENAPEIARGITTPADRPEELEGEPLEPVDSNDDEEPEDDSDAEPEREPSGNLGKFAKSDEKGLANNPEEKEAIEELQQFLTDLGYDTKGIDGIYGGGTTDSVRQFQQAFGLTVDGDAGPNTIQAIQDYRNDMEQLDMLLGRIENNNQTNAQTGTEQNSSAPASTEVGGE